MSGFDHLSVLVLAGGRGTRLQGLYPDLPKPMIPVAGAPFLSWLTRWIARHGPNHFIYSTGHHAGTIAQWAQDGSLPGLSRQCCPEERPLGTGGALLHCLPLCREWVLVLNGDSLLLEGLDKLLALTGQPKSDGGLIGVMVEDTARYGSLRVDEEGFLSGFQEKIPGRGWINGGVYLFRSAVLRAPGARGPCSLEYDLFPALIATGARLRVIPVAHAPFIDIGTPDSLAQAEDFVRTHFERTGATEAPTLTQVR